MRLKRGQQGVLLGCNQNEEKRTNKSIIKKINFENPPLGYKIYYREKSTKENKEIIITAETKF